MKRTLAASLLALAAWASPGRAQEQTPAAPSAPAVETATAAVSTGPVYLPLPMDRGPWIVGQVVFLGNDAIADFTLRGVVRARPGVLYTPSDIANDVAELTKLPGVLSAEPALFAIPGKTVPESYRTIVVSTAMVKVVYTIVEKAIHLPGLTRPVDEERVPELAPGVVPAALSGIVMTPTAYRSIDQYNRPGMGLDFDAVYFIGRLYGKNNLSTRRTNFIDRVGVWFLNADGKMQLQGEGRFTPAMSVGARGSFTFRDGPQPNVNAPGVSVKIDHKTTRAVSDGYLVLSKKIYRVRSSLGFSQGNAGDRVGLLSEFMSPSFLPFTGNPNAEAKSRSVFFGSLLMTPRPDVPIAVEFLKPNGMVLDPILINFKIGYYLKLNFDVAYLRFRGGWDLLGMFQFRYTHFPSTVPAKKKS